MTDLPRIDLEAPLKTVFLPIFLKVVLPFVLLILIFSIFRVIFRMVLKRSPTAAKIVDVLICLVFLVNCGLIAPIVIKSVKNFTIPDEAYDIAVNADGTPYEFTDPFDPENYPDVASNVEFTDPFDPERFKDMVTNPDGTPYEFTDPFGSSDSSDVDSSSSSSETE